MKKRFLIYLLTLCFIILTGCWDYEEYENIAIISAVGVDYNSQTDEFMVSLQKLSTSKGGSDSSEKNEASVNKVGTVHSITCKTIYEGILKFQTVFSNKMFFGYTTIIIIGEDAAKHKLIDIVDLMDRTPSLRAKAYIVIVQNALDTLSTIDYSKTQSSAYEINDLIDLSVNSGASCPVSLQDFEQMLAISGLEAVAPYITSSSNEKTEAKGGVEDGIRSYEQRFGNNILAGTAVFKGDKFVGYLDDKESQGYVWITGQKVHEFKTSLPSNGEKTSDFAYYYIKNAKSSFEVNLENNQPEIDLSVNITAELRKNVNDSESDILLPEQLDELETMLSDSIRSDIEAALSKCQKEYKSDVFGFGFKLFRKNPTLWNTKYEKEWDTIYPELPVNIEVNSEIISTGTNIRRFVVK